MSVFRIRTLPAGHGDAILVEYGRADSLRRLLIDAGPPVSWKTLKPLLMEHMKGSAEIELLVVSHVDADHIGGTIPLLSDELVGLTIKDVWFNGYRHLSRLEEFGPIQGE